MTPSTHQNRATGTPTVLALVTCLLASNPSSAEEGDLPPDASHMPDVATKEKLGRSHLAPPPLPSWGEDEPKLVPRLWPGNSGSPSPPPTTVVPEIQLPPEVDPSVIPDLYLADYFGTIPEGLLVDPQTLLTAHERTSINRALKEHLNEHHLPVYILLFDREQQIPEFQNLETVQSRWFGDRPGLVVGFWLASPTRTSAFFGDTLREQYDTLLDKAFADALGQSYTKDYPFSQLDHFIYTLLWRLAHLDEAAPGSDTASRLGKRTSASPPEFEPIDSTGWIPIAATGSALALAAAALGASFIILRRRREWRRQQQDPVILPVTLPAERLGAPNSGGSGAAIRAVEPVTEMPS